MLRDAGVAIVLAALGSLSPLVPAHADPPASSPENDLKGAFLYRFATYVEWPSGSAAATGERFIHCVLGDDPLAEALERTVAGKLELGKPLEVRRLRSVRDAGPCAVLFVGAGGFADLRATLASVARKPILTVGDADEFTREGGIIRLYREEGKLRFEIDPAAAGAAGLRLSSRLLSLARIVPPRPRGAP